MKKILSLIFILFPAVALFAAPDYYLTGSFNDWKPNLPAYKFTENGDIYTLKVSSLSGDFKITTANWEHQYGCASPLEYGVTYKCVESGNAYNMTLASGSGRDIIFTFDDKNKTVTVEAPESLYLVGDFNAWVVSEVYRFQREGDLFTLRTHDFTGNFKIVSSVSSLSFGGAGSGDIAVGKELPLLSDGPSMSFGGLTGGFGTLKITIDPASDFSMVLPVEDDFSPQPGMVEYYNLQGIRVENPAPGLYIRRTGNSVEKIIIR